MQNEIKWFKDNGADGFVFGILNEDASIDMKRTSKLVHLAGTLPVTFHRAFDISKDLDQSLEDIINCGCSRILSSGGASCVNNGFEKLSELHKQTKSRIDIMPGGGVTIDNVRKFINHGFKNIHLSSKKNIMSKMITQSKLSLTSNPYLSMIILDLMLRNLKNLFLMSVNMKYCSFLLILIILINSCQKKNLISSF